MGLCTGRTALRGSRCIVLPFLDHDTRRRLGVSATPRPLFTSRKDPVPIVQEAGCAPGSVWKGAEYLAPTGIRSQVAIPTTLPGPLKITQAEICPNMSVVQVSLIYSTSPQSDIPDVCRYSPHKICAFSFVIGATLSVILRCTYQVRQEMSIHCMF